MSRGIGLICCSACWVEMNSSRLVRIVSWEVAIMQSEGWVTVEEMTIKVSCCQELVKHSSFGLAHSYIGEGFCLAEMFNVEL